IFKSRSMLCAIFCRLSAMPRRLEIIEEQNSGQKTKRETRISQKTRMSISTNFLQVC
ncbi:hypothetical protein BT96DRAFT_928218, partial [Gymnopus androsaceus JB14]